MEIQDINIKTEKNQITTGEQLVLLEGTHAVALAVALCRVKVIAAYPITPSSSIAEKLSDMVAEGKLNAKYIRVESEYSSMTSLIGAAHVGVRTFSATSSQGLAYMHEVLHWAAGSRLPIVLCNANRALGAPWNLGADQTDSLSQRDTGWLQFYCEHNQDALDTIIQAYRIAEEILLPVMVNLDAFYATHTMERLYLPSQEMVDQFLPLWNSQYKIDFTNPGAIGGIAHGETYFKFKYKSHQAMQKALTVIQETETEYENLTGRAAHEMVKGWYTEDAEIIVVSAGTSTGTVRTVVKRLRELGFPVGLIRIRLFRPFPAEAVFKKLKNAKKIVVIDRNIGLGIGGIFAQEVKAALYNYGLYTPLFSFIDGLGGKDITPESIEQAIAFVKKQDRPKQNTYWIGIDV